MTTEDRDKFETWRNTRDDITRACRRGISAARCYPLANQALTSIRRTVRRWALHHRSDKSLQDLAEMYNPRIRDSINYYSHFYKTQLRPTPKRIDLYVIRWARQKFKPARSRKDRLPSARRARRVWSRPDISVRIPGGLPACSRNIVTTGGPSRC
jgi:hypothetical protein